MADPVEYEVAFDFSAYQGAHPTDPLPGDDLDVELAGIAESLASLILALADVRRADGGLANGSVTLDALDADVAALFDSDVHTVTVGDISETAFAAQVEAEAGVANDKLMTPLRVTQALDSLRGFASKGEAELGEAGDVVMSPLRVMQALDALRAMATQVQAEEGTVSTAVMSPLRVKQALDALRAISSQSAAETGSDNTMMMTPLRVSQALAALRAFATKAEAEAGSSNAVVMTPLRTVQSMDEFRGFASQAQAEAGTNDATVVSPLKVANALDALRAFASQAQAEAGVNTATVMSPLRTAQAIAEIRPALNQSAALTYGSISAGSYEDQTIAVTGAVVGDRVVVGLPASISGAFVVTVFVSSADTVTVRYSNISAAPSTPYSGAATSHSVTVMGF